MCSVSSSTTWYWFLDCSTSLYWSTSSPLLSSTPASSLFNSFLSSSTVPYITFGSYDFLVILSDSTDLRLGLSLTFLFEAVFDFKSFKLFEDILSSGEVYFWDLSHDCWWFDIWRVEISLWVITSKFGFDALNGFATCRSSDDLLVNILNFKSPW